MAMVMVVLLCLGVVLHVGWFFLLGGGGGFGHVSPAAAFSRSF